MSALQLVNCLCGRNIMNYCYCQPKVELPITGALGAIVAQIIFFLLGNVSVSVQSLIWPYVLWLWTHHRQLIPMLMFSFSDWNRAFPGDLLKHTCPFSPTYLIAVGTLINPHAVCHLPCTNPISADELGQTAPLVWRPSSGTGIRDLYKFGPQFTKD